MKLKISIFDNVYNNLFDVSNLVSDLSVSTYISDNPGKCTFKIRAIQPLSFWEGATVSVVVDDYPLFKGFVFKKSRDKDVRKIDVTCYDQLRYLKNQDTKVFENVTADQIFSQLCDEYVLNYTVISPTNYICSPRSEDNISLYDMIKNANDNTLTNTGEWYYIRDNFGTLEFRNVKDDLMLEVLGDKSYVTNFSYDTSIDDDVYTQIKLYKDNKEAGTREVYIVNDTINDGEKLRRWGILQLYKKVDDNYSYEQLEQMAISMLKFYGTTSRELKLDCLGIKEFHAGCIFKCDIKDLGDLVMNSYLLVTECTHNFSDNVHTMELKTEVVKNI